MSTQPDFGLYARQRLEEALSHLTDDGADVDVLGPAAEGLMALHLYYGSADPFMLDPADVVESIRERAREAKCTCPPDLVARGGFRSGCPVHHLTR